MSSPDHKDDFTNADERQAASVAQAADYRSYLLRLWRSRSDTGWRGSLQSAQSGERHMFADMESLVAFLRGLSP